MNLKLFLKLLFGAIFVWMTVMTIRTCLTMSLWAAWDSYAANPWAVATLWDAYSGFTIFFSWVCYKETSWAMRVLWFLLIMGLGNIATSLYLLIQLFRLAPESPAQAILWRNA
jgi:hypothetical protein